jgi:hypothetical protein
MAKDDDGKCYVAYTLFYEGNSSHAPHSSTGIGDDYDDFACNEYGRYHFKERDFYNFELVDVDGAKNDIYFTDKSGETHRLSFIGNSFSDVFVSDSGIFLYCSSSAFHDEWYFSVRPAEPNVDSIGEIEYHSSDSYPVDQSNRYAMWVGIS